jgi:hypothetical protein
MKRTPLKRTAIKRSNKPMKKARSKPRPGRLKGQEMSDLRLFVFMRDRGRCQHVLRRDEFGDPVAICGKETPWESGHLAHIVSRGAGGPDTPENTCWKCADCHLVREHTYGPSGVKPVPKKIKGEDHGT